ncbi:MAG TPA: hypothetical protein PK796_00940 [Bacteroidales bacterium]|jgi:hypothetical protein|nr:hypothetical protein [Bacteroidales bacterium]
MKAINLYLFLIFSAAMLFAVSCEDIDNPDDTGDPRDKMTGTWQFIENSVKSTRSLSYVVTITKDPDNSSQVILKNFGNPGTSDIQSVGITTSSQIVVTEQTLSNGWVVEGSGKLDGTETMNWTYSIIVGGDLEQYTAVATKL